ncbi:MAG: hypothetical protein COY69_03365 [Candidatus Magasanikbacteria bacterium CG_4_10_14_0_8_um_filter_32_14]|uniref:Bacterial spore germination immunoglobulin-like domain-containing protein n=1 Tax=Candidatus Magasanikbacteria bacterium CG_4_10_14_0_8_um_filter_32_14 TaxID=1974640 RepID=A0A2M7R979_9BACT|nr:MAG: hypothetical protein COY69_03365 [Candidatus Magasanikbacteria bacterium CG_4_10_14_0_8_um_filter_32_14]
MKKVLIVFIGLLILGIGGFLICSYFWQKNLSPLSDNQNNTTNKRPTSTIPEIVINNFNDCVSADNPVMESYPRQCRASQNNVTYTEEIGNAPELLDKIVLENPLPNQIITSPITIKGKARGTWFFEASFPVVLTNWDGLIIAQGIATAKSDWMTTEFVPFEVTLTFETPTYKNNGSLILKKDNPSGLPENDAALEIPVFFDMK